MNRNLYTAFGLLFTISALAQPGISVDSVALFQIDQDQLAAERGLVRAKGFVSQFKAYEDGHLEVGVFRQHIGYLSTQKGTGVKTGPNALPALWRLTYQNGRLQPQAEPFPNITSGLSKTFPYRLQTIVSQVGGMRTQPTNLTDNTTAIDYVPWRTENATALGYRGDSFTELSMDVEKNQLVVTQNRYEYLPFPNRYRPLGQPVSRAYPLLSKQQPNYRLNESQGTMTYHRPEADQLVTLDTLGRTLQTLALEGMAGKRLMATSKVMGENPAPVATEAEINQHVGTDWLFGPAENKAKNPEMLLLRTDTQGKLVFRHAFTVSHEEYVLAQVDLISNDTDVLVNITMGKSILKYAIVYARINAGGVVYQRLWDRKDPAQTVRVNGGGIGFRAFTNLQRLVTLPGGELLLISNDSFASPTSGQTILNGYGALQLSAQGDMLRYYSLRAHVPPGLSIPLPAMRVLSQPDGRVMLWVNEARNSQAAQFSSFSLLDTELQEGALPEGTRVVAGQSSVLLGATEVNLMARPVPTKGGGFFGGLARMAEKTESLRNKLGVSGLSEGETKLRGQIEGSPFNRAPVLYWIDTKAGTALVRDFGRVGGYSLPGQPFMVFNRTRSEAYVPLRTPLQATGPQSTQFPQAVYLKVARLNW